MTDRTPPRLWRGLGLTAAVGLAAGPALALAPAGPDAPPWEPLVRAQAEGGEAGEAGETGALAADAPVVALLAGLGLMEGHLRSGIEAAELGDGQAAAVHLAHPAAELHEAVEPLVEAQGLPNLDPELDALEAAADGPARIAAAQGAIARFEEVRAALAPSPAQRFAALSAMLRTAAAEYEASVQDGRLVNPEEYQDARGFVAAARAEAERLAGAEDGAVAAAARQAVAALDEAAPAFPSFRPDALPADAAQIVAGAAARVEFAGLTVR